MARRWETGTRAAIVCGSAVLASVLCGCDPGPSRSTTETPPTSVPTSLPTAAPASGDASVARGAVTTPQTPSSSTAIPTDVKISLPPFDVSNKPQPVRMAYNEMKRAVETQPTPLNEALTIAALHYVHGNASDAVKIVTQVAAVQPDHALTQHMLGLCQEKAAAPDEALKCYEKVIAIEPQFAPAHVRIGVLLIEKDRARARAAFEKAIEVLPEDPRPHLGLAKILKSEGKNEEAYRKCLDAIERFPAYAEAQKDAAELSDLLGRKDEAERHKQRAAQGGLPPSADPMLSRMLLIGLELRRVVQEGFSLAESGDYKTAEEMLMKAIPLDAQGSTAQRAMASVKVQSGKLDDAASLLRALIESNPKDASAIYQYADVLTRQGRSEEALEQCAKVAELAPQDARVPFLIGGIHFSAGKLDEAKKSWTKALEMAPAFEDAYIRLAEVASKQRDFPEYVRVLKAGLQIIPESPLLANGLAWVYSTNPDEKFRNGEEAVKLAEGAVKATGGRMHQLIDTLACAYAEVGRFPDAVKRIDEAASLATDPAQKSFLEQYRTRQKLFRTKKPFRDIPEK